MNKQDGFLYILRHPSRTFAEYGLGDDEHLFKVGVTTRTVKIRLKQHNTDFKKAAGRVVRETGQLWEVHEVYSVQNVYAAEKLFWQHTHISVIPFRGGEEIWPMKPKDVETALDAVLRLSYCATKVDRHS
jgi:hypothetical protein